MGKRRRVLWDIKVCLTYYNVYVSSSGRFHFAGSVQICRISQNLKNGFIASLYYQGYNLPFKCVLTPQFAFTFELLSLNFVVSI